MNDIKVRCEGWTRRGGAFTFGPVEWKQCPNDAIVNLTVHQNKKNSIQPACMECWQEGIRNNISILHVEPINPTTKCHHCGKIHKMAYTPYDDSIDVGWCPYRMRTDE